MILPADKIKERIIKKYNSDPSEWRVIFGRDNYGHYNTAIGHESDIWIIKEEQINPYKFVGYGTKVNSDVDILKKISPYSFGLRPISEKQIEKLATGFSLRNNKFKEILSNIMKTNPSPINELNSKIILQGPVVSSDQTTKLISQKNKELDLKLRKELRKLLYKKYPQTINPYV